MKSGLSPKPPPPIVNLIHHFYFILFYFYFPYGDFGANSMDLIILGFFKKEYFFKFYQSMIFPKSDPQNLSF